MEQFGERPVTVPVHCADAPVEKPSSSDHFDPCDRTISLDASQLAPHVTWGTNPGMVAPIDGRVPDPTRAASDDDRRSIEQALRYMEAPGAYRGNEPYKKGDRAWFNSPARPVR